MDTKKLNWIALKSYRLQLELDKLTDKEKEYVIKQAQLFRKNKERLNER